MQNRVAPIDGNLAVASMGKPKSKRSMCSKIITVQLIVSRSKEKPNMSYRSILIFARDIWWLQSESLEIIKFIWKYVCFLTSWRMIHFHIFSAEATFSNVSKRFPWNIRHLIFFMKSRNVLDSIGGKHYFAPIPTLHTRPELKSSTGTNGFYDIF